MPDAIVNVNGDEISLPLGCTVRQLLERLEMGGKRVAVAVNRSVIPRSNFASCVLDPGDRIEILEAVGGG